MWSTTFYFGGQPKASQPDYNRKWTLWLRTAATSPSLPPEKPQTAALRKHGHIQIWNNSQSQNPSSKIPQAFARENSSSLQLLPFWLALTLFWNHQQNTQAVGTGYTWQTNINTTPRAALKPVAITVTTEYVGLTPLSRERFFFPFPLSNAKTHNRPLRYGFPLPPVQHLHEIWACQSNLKR